MVKDHEDGVVELPGPEVDYEEEMEKTYFLSLQGDKGYKKKWVYGYAFWKGQYTARNARYNKMMDDQEDKLKSLFKSCANDDVLGRLYHKIDMLNDHIDADLYGYFSEKDLSYDLLREYIEQKNSVRVNFPYMNNPIIYQMDVLFDICRGLFPPNAGLAGYFSGQFPNNRARTLSYNGVDKFGRGIFAIDLTAEISSIIAEFRNAVEKIKKATAPDAPDERFITCGGADPELTRVVRLSELQCATCFDDRDVVALYEELQAKGAAYKPMGDESRAVGLLMFDLSPAIHTISTT